MSREKQWYDLKIMPNSVFTFTLMEIILNLKKYFLRFYII